MKARADGTRSSDGQVHLPMSGLKTADSLGIDLATIRTLEDPFSLHSYIAPLVSAPPSPGFPPANPAARPARSRTVHGGRRNPYQKERL